MVSQICHILSCSTPSVKSNLKVTSRPLVGDLVGGLGRSRTLRAIVVTSIVTALATGVLFLVLSPPPQWMMGAVIGSGLAVGFLLGVCIQLPNSGLQKTGFEYSILGRLCIAKNYDEIYQLNGAKLILGAIPNRLRLEGERLANEEGVGAVLSINEPWERNPLGLSIPYQERDWEELEVIYETYDVDDHTLLDIDSLQKSADFINRQLEGGKGVYVHCRGGAGRSAMAVAAFLIKHQKFSVDEVCKLIKEKRSLSSINKKRVRLEEYYSIVFPGE